MPWPISPAPSTPTLLIWVMARTLLAARRGLLLDLQPGGEADRAAPVRGAQDHLVGARLELLGELQRDRALAVQGAQRAPREDLAALAQRDLHARDRPGRGECESELALPGRDRLRGQAERGGRRGLGGRGRRRRGRSR